MTSLPEAGAQRRVDPVGDAAGQSAHRPARGASRRARRAHRLHDKLAVDQLMVTLRAMHPHAVPQAYIAQWWDGITLVPALLAEVEGRNVRVVLGPDGGVVLLPRSSWLARRRLRRGRRTAGAPLGPDDRPHVALTPGGLPRTPLLYEVGGRRPRPPRAGRPGPRVPVRIGEALDYRACTQVGCGAIVALPAAGPDPPCPRCGRR